MKPVVIGLAVLAAAVVGVGGYFLFRGDQSENPSEEGIFSQGGEESGSLPLHQPDDDEYPVYIYVYSAAELRTGADGGLLRDLLTGARVSLRIGAGARTGEALKTLEAGADGTIDTTLPAGTYTSQIDVDGYF